MRSIGENFVQIYTSCIFEILQVTNSITRRLYSPEVVAHIVVPMHLSLTNYNTSSTVSGIFSGRNSLATALPEVAIYRYLSCIAFDSGPVGC